jgi:hypothetical protein
MGKFAIRKTVKLDFLGDEYKDAYLVFKTIPIKEYANLLPAINQMEEDRIKSSEKVIEIIKDKFIAGKTLTEDGELEAITTDELDDILDEEVSSHVFAVITGQKIDPK